MQTKTQELRLLIYEQYIFYGRLPKVEETNGLEDDRI